ncbi:DNA polymerase II [Thermococcus eurythermalis]|uniref:DNA polymerase II small subunit n=1 Tax=Thermococcus eurythermalis TaxID=1505907 RepID=A0A097QS16_9EURY|nr:DNA-directed DNA polymerase II small subunit [Thermococcus eurythermalis]AIU69270.1 DNA polymerase II [Thermococcus eurythermalis]
MLVEDLIKNNYLITPSAYYLLEPHYKRDFTLAELIKFAKARGTFVIDSALAMDFLVEKGVVSTGSPDDSAPEEATEETPVSPADVGYSEDVVETGETSVSESVEGDSPEDIAPSDEAVLAEDAGSISTGDVVESGVATASSGEESVEPAKIVGETSISTGATAESEQFPASNPVEESISSEISEGESFISTGTPEPEELVDEASGSLDSSLTEVVEDSLPVEAEPLNGNGYGNYADSEEYYENGENGNGVKPKIVYGDYGIPIAYVGEDVEGEKSYSTYRDVVIRPKEGFHYRAKEIPDDWEVTFDVKNVKFEAPKVKNAASKEGEIIIQAYSNYFKSRLKKMRRIFRENPEIGTVIDIAKLSYVRDDEVTIIGLVNDKRETAKGYMFEVEDATGRVKVFLGRDKENASQAYNAIMPDSVVAFRGQSGRGIFFANRVFLPDVPKFRREKPPLEEKVYAILLSDIHVGSNKFCEKAFEKFLEWLNGEVNSRAEEELVSRIKYMIIGGDVVDGVGIYPGQYNELEIPDIFDQYEALANLLRNVPDHITMFIGPGNHDAARTALPQPGFYEEYAKPLYKLKNAVIISNPAVINLHGREFLVAHGRGIEDVVDFIPGRSHHHPAQAMVDLLKLRHIAPTFGNKVPIAPDPEDTLVIESVPDLFQAGHVHVMEYQIYSGVFVINTGTWQAQTEFQKMVNIVPTPARVPIIDVETARLRAVVSFDQFCEGV